MWLLPKNCQVTRNGTTMTDKTDMSDKDNNMHKKLLMGFVGIAAGIIAYQLYQRLNGPKHVLPGPKPSNKESGNFADMGKAGSLHQYLQVLTNEYGPIGAFWWGSTRVAYITTNKILLDEENKRLFANLSDRPPFLFDGFKPLITSHSIQYVNGPEFKVKYHDVYLASYQRNMVNKIPIMTKLALQHINSWSDSIGMLHCIRFIHSNSEKYFYFVLTVLY